MYDPRPLQQGTRYCLQHAQGSTQNAAHARYPLMPSCAVGGGGDGADADAESRGCMRVILKCQYSGVFLTLYMDWYTILIQVFSRIIRTAGTLTPQSTAPSGLVD